MTIISPCIEGTTILLMSIQRNSELLTEAYVKYMLWDKFKKLFEKYINFNYLEELYMQLSCA